MKVNLRQIAMKELDRLGFQETPNNWHQYRHPNIPDAGILDLSCRLSLGGGRKNSLNIFMCFDNPKQAQQAGFNCNPYSGKYNFLSNTTKNEILYVIGHLFEFRS